MIMREPRARIIFIAVWGSIFVTILCLLMYNMDLKIVGHGGEHDGDVDVATGLGSARCRASPLPRLTSH